MAPRPAWKGYLKLSLVTCRVELSNAVSMSEKISFRILNRDTGNPVNRVYVDRTTGKPLKEGDEVKGYESGDDSFLLVEEDEIDALRIESSHTLDLEGFVSKAEIDPVYLDTPYYMTPGDKVSEEAFAVIRTALENGGKAGLARIVLFRRERPCLIEPLGKGMLLTTLRYEGTVRSPDSVPCDEELPMPDGKLVDLAVEMVRRQKGKFEPQKFDYAYQDALAKLIASKKAGRKPRKPKEEKAPPPSNVVNLFDALKQSLAGDRKSSGKSATKAGGKSSSKRKSTEKA